MTSFRLMLSLTLCVALEAAGPKPAPEWGKIPLSFEANLGQTAKQVRYLARGSGYTLYLTPREAVLGLRPNREGRVENSSACCA